MNVNSTSHSTPEVWNNATVGNRLYRPGNIRFQNYQLCANGRIKPSYGDPNLVKLAGQDNYTSAGSASTINGNLARARQTSAEIELVINQKSEKAAVRCNNGNFSGSWVRLNDKIYCSMDGRHYVVMQDSIPMHFYMNEAGNEIISQGPSTATQTKSPSHKEGGDNPPSSILSEARKTLQSFLTKQFSYHSHHSHHSHHSPVKPQPNFISNQNPADKKTVVFYAGATPPNSPSPSPKSGAFAFTGV